jgi:hypothetical protein
VGESFETTGALRQSVIFVERYLQRETFRVTDVPKDKVVDFSEKRAKKIEEKRRRTERRFFDNVLGVYSVVQGIKPREITLLDLSEEGLAFHIETESGPWPTSLEPIALRLYFTSDTFLEITAFVQNVTPFIQKGRKYTRVGCQLDTQQSTYAVFLAFVRFLKLFGEHSRKDLGDVTSFYL